MGESRAAVNLQNQHGTFFFFFLNKLWYIIINYKLGKAFQRKCMFIFRERFDFPVKRDAKPDEKF